MFTHEFDLQHKRKHFSFIIGDKTLLLDPAMYSTYAWMTRLNSNISLDKSGSFILFLYDAKQCQSSSTTITNAFPLPLTLNSPSGFKWQPAGKQQWSVAVLRKGLLFFLTKENRSLEGYLWYSFKNNLARNNFKEPEKQKLMENRKYAKVQLIV